MNKEKYTQNMTESHSYIVNVAADVGVNSAVLFSNILFWVRYNKANNQNFYEGKFWTYNSRKAWAELFPEFSEDQIKRSLAKLKEAGYIVTGDFNQNPYDHTLWYSLSDEAEGVFLNNEFSRQRQSIDRAKSPNRMGINAQPRLGEIAQSCLGEIAQSCLGEIAQSTNTDINKTDIKQNNISPLTPLSNEKGEELIKGFEQEIIDEFNKRCSNLPKVSKLTPQRKKAINARLKDFDLKTVYEVFDKAQASDFLSGKTTNWKAKFDWLMNPNNFIKVLEDNYKNSTAIQKVGTIWKQGGIQKDDWGF